MPYGNKLVGHVHFDEENQFGCNTFNTSAVLNNEEKAPIVFVRRGSCSFVTKVRNIEHAGGKLAVIVDEKDNENPEKIIMVDNGTGNGIGIPSLMIGKKDGEKIIEFFQTAPDDKKK